MSQKRPAADWPPTQMLEVEHGFSTANAEERISYRGRIPGPVSSGPDRWDPAALQRTAGRFDAALGEVVPVLLWTLWLWRVRQWSSPSTADSPPPSEASYDYQSRIDPAVRSTAGRPPLVRELVFDAVARLGAEASLGEGRVSAAELHDLAVEPESLVRLLQRFRYAQRLRDKEHWQIERCRVETDAAAGIDRDVCTPCEPWRRLELGGDDYRTALTLTVMLTQTASQDAPASPEGGTTLTGVLLTDARRAALTMTACAEPPRPAETVQQAVAFALFPILETLGISVPARQEAAAATQLLGELASEASLDRFRALHRWVRAFRRSDPDSPRNRLIDWMVPELTATHPTGRYLYELSFRLYLRMQLRRFLIERGWGPSPSRGPSSLDQSFGRLTRDALGELLSEAVRGAVDQVGQENAYVETGLSPTSVQQTKELLAASA